MLCYFYAMILEIMGESMSYLRSSDSMAGFLGDRH